MAFLLSCPIFGKDLSLQEVMGKVESQNFEVRAARAQTGALEQGYAASSGRYYPKLDLDTRYTHLNDEITMDLSPIRTAIISSSAAAAGATAGANGPAVSGAFASGLNTRLPAFDLQVQKQDYFNAALILTQPIYTGGKIGAAREAKYSEWKASELQTEDTRDRLLIAATQAYYGVHLTQISMEVRKELLDRLKNHQVLSDKLLAEGQITKVTKMNADVKLVEAEAEYLKSKHENQMAWNQLGNLINEKLDATRLSTDLRIGDRMEDLEYYRERAAQRNKSLKTVDRRMEMLDAKYTATRADHLPSVFAFGRYELYKHDLTLTEPEWYVGIGMKINILSGGEVSSNIAQVRSEQSAAQYTRESTKQQIDLGVQKLYTDMQIANDQYRTLQSAVSLAEKSVELSASSYKNGVLRSVDVIDAYALLASVKLSRFKALYDYNLALFQLKRLSGDAGDLLQTTGRDNK